MQFPAPSAIHQGLDAIADFTEICGIEDECLLFAGAFGYSKSASNGPSLKVAAATNSILATTRENNRTIFEHLSLRVGEALPLCCEDVLLPVA